MINYTTKQIIAQGLLDLFFENLRGLLDFCEGTFDLRGLLDLQIGTFGFFQVIFFIENDRQKQRR